MADNDPQGTSKYVIHKRRGRWRRMIRGGAQDRVISVYYYATCLYRGRVDGVPMYVVYNGPGQLGAGTNPRLAWEDACRNVFADKLAG